MKTKQWLSSVVAVIALYSQVHAAEVEWRVPTSVPGGSPFYENFLERFSRNTEILTSGRANIRPFGAGVIVPALQVYDAVKEGTVEAGHSSAWVLNRLPGGLTG